MMMKMMMTMTMFIINIAISVYNINPYSYKWYPIIFTYIPNMLRFNLCFFLFDHIEPILKLSFIWEKQSIFIYDSCLYIVFVCVWGMCKVRLFHSFNQKHTSFIWLQTTTNSWTHRKKYFSLFPVSELLQVSNI